MEVVPYILDVLMFTLAVYWSAANAAAKGGKVFGLFRYRDTPGVSAAPADPAKDRRRVFQPAVPGQAAPGQAAPRGPAPGRGGTAGGGRDAAARPAAARRLTDR